MPALKRFGAIVDFDSAGSAIVSIVRVDELHTGGMESRAINGMTLMGLMDTAMCAASLFRLGLNVRCATLEMSVKFIKPVLGEPVRSIGHVISRSDDILFCEASVFDFRGRIRVTASGMIKKLRSRSRKKYD